MRILLSLFFLLVSITGFAQSPQGINYQGVAYDNAGNPVANQLVGIRFKILQGSATGPVLYSERQRPNTDNTGLFAIVIGNGTVLSGSFSSVNWGSGSKWLKVEMDITGGVNYIEMGCSQFWSVPYAFYTDKAGRSMYADSAGYTKMSDSSNYAANAGNAAAASYANNAAHAVHSDTASYADNAGFFAGSLAIPDGFKNVVTVVIADSVEYTVPAGKNLYIPSSENLVKIDTNRLWTNYRGGGANARTFIVAGENSSVFVGFSPIAAFLVDKKVEWKTFNLLAGPFTVPAGKQFVIVNTSTESFSTSTFINGIDVRPSIPNQVCKLTLNNVPCLIVSNMVLGSGDTISTTGCGSGSSSYYYTINGYLMNR